LQSLFSPGEDIYLIFRELKYYFKVQLQNFCAWVSLFFLKSSFVLRSSIVASHYVHLQRIDGAFTKAEIWNAWCSRNRQNFGTKPHIGI